MAEPPGLRSQSQPPILPYDDVNQQQLPNITGLANETAVMLFRLYSQNEIYKMNYDGATWCSSVWVASGRYPSVSMGYTSAKYVWTEGTASPYQIKISSETLSNIGECIPTLAYHRSVAVLDTAGRAWFEVRLDKLSVKTRTGGEVMIPLVTAQEDSLTLTPAKAFTNLASSPIFLSADAESLSVVCVVSGQSLSAIKNPSTVISVELILAGKGGATVHLPVVITNAENLPETKLALAAKIATLAGGEFSLRTQVSGIAQQKASLIASLGHIYEIVETSLPKILDRAAEMAAPKDFTLTAYPNPFNPSTQIHFAMPVAGIAALRIYNLNGQLIRELLHEHRGAGEHMVLWDGRDDQGITAASGVYFIRFEAGHEVKVGKVMLVR